MRALLQLQTALGSLIASLSALILGLYMVYGACLVARFMWRWAVGR